MLNQTQNPFKFQYNHFNLTPLPPPPAVSATKKMELLEGVLRMEDFMVSYGQNDVAGEDFFVEDLLVDGGDGFFEVETGDKNGCETEDKNPTPLSPSPKTEEVKDTIFGSVPDADVSELEWLSHFVEDSFSGYSMTCQVTGNPVQASVTTLVQTKVRTKRARTGGRVWSSKSLTESSSSTLSSVESDSWLVYSGQTAESLFPAPPVQAPKKQKMRVSTVPAVSVPRRCSHCGIQKTPQWRAGPMGAKTLCNACGVRFKSGRLFPEYRPACSPTFSSERHSNNHRKVLEMRMKKDGLVDVTVSAVWPDISSPTARF